jgi:hypothetical protein
VNSPNLDDVVEFRSLTFNDTPAATGNQRFCNGDVHSGCPAEASAHLTDRRLWRVSLCHSFPKDAIQDHRRDRTDKGGRHIGAADHKPPMAKHGAPTEAPNQASASFAYAASEPDTKQCDGSGSW